MSFPKTDIVSCRRPSIQERVCKTN